jgi:DNA polymerase-3 subunit delta'
MQFSDVIGQPSVKTHLSEMISQNRLSHALLFTGKEGSGALSMALAFAQYVLCEKVSRALQPAGPSLFGDAEPLVTEIPKDSCGECNACKKAADLVHPDIHFSYPVVPKKPGDKPISTDYASEWREFITQYPYGNVYDWLQYIGAENKQGNITAHECNDIIRKLNLKSFESEYKILVMWMPEYLGNEGNKLLKLIEEPPANTLFILVTENENQVLQTILSRTQLVKIPPLSAKDIEVALTEKSKLNPDQARQLALVSGGNYREALQLVQHAGEDWLSLLREWLNSIMKSGPIAQVKWIEEQQAIVEELDKAAYYIERNANAKMLFHALTIRLYHIIADKSLILTT